MSRHDDVLERLVSAAVGGAGPALLVGVLGRGLGASWCRLEMAAEVVEWASSGTGAAEIGAAGIGTPVRYGGTVLGSLTAGGGRRWRRRRSLLEDAAAILGPVLHADATRRTAEGLQAAARRDADAVVEARRRAIDAREAERRTLERNLHDGPQHHLVALRMATGLLEFELAAGVPPRGDGAAAHGGLARVESLLDVTERGLAATAAGRLPPALLESGLLVGVERELATAAAVRVEADPLVAARRYPLGVEVAVFFACLEAVGNARKHAPGAAVTVHLGHTYRGLSFTVQDDGPGFDPACLSPGSGLMLLAGRLATAGGELVLRTAPGAGTTVEGFVPI